MQQRSAQKEKTFLSKIGTSEICSYWLCAVLMGEATDLIRPLDLFKGKYNFEMVFKIMGTNAWDFFFLSALV